MTFSDFQIFNDETYSFLEEQYKQTLTFDRRTTINKIYLKLKECVSFCCNINIVNKKIKESIENAKTQILNVIENFDSNFSVNLDSYKEYKNFNVFSLMKCLTIIINELQVWQKSESKDYHKLFIHNTLTCLINILFLINNALEKSNIILFKHM